MTKQTPVTLASTLHDPNGELIRQITGRVGREISKGFHWIIVVTEETPLNNIPQELFSGRVEIHREDMGKFATNRIRNSHLQALNFGFETGSESVFYADGDRVVADSLAYKGAYSEVLNTLGETPSKFGVISLIREIGDENLPRKATEGLVNRLLQDASGIPLDPFGSFIIFRRQELREILSICMADRDREVSFPTMEWTIEALKHKLGVVGVWICESPIGRYEDPIRSDEELQTAAVGYIDKRVGKRRLFEGGLKDLWKVMESGNGDVFEEAVERRLSTNSPRDIFEGYAEVSSSGTEWRKRIRIAREAINDLVKSGLAKDAGFLLRAREVKDKIETMELIVGEEEKLGEPQLAELRKFDRGLALNLAPECFLPETLGMVYRDGKATALGERVKRGWGERIS